MNGKEPVCCNTKNVYTRCIGIAATLCLILFLGQTFVSHSSLAFVQVFSHDRGITLAEEEQRIRRQFCNQEPVPPSANSVEDLLCKPMPTFLPNYKNPCWYNGGKLNCLPYFMLIGMDKSGSTDLFGRLTRHPEVLSNIKDKETMWWSWLRYGNWLVGVRETLTFNDYISFYEAAAGQIENTTNSEGYHNYITGDGTPMDMWDFRGWKKIPQNLNKSMPDILTPHLVRHVNPNMKFIIILRNPVDRLYSDYFFLKLGTPTSEAFDVAVNKSLGHLQDCLNVNSLKQCLYDDRNHEFWDYQTRIHLGFYSVYINEWFSVFPREQFFILRTEDFSQNMEYYLSQIFEFLGVEKLSTELMLKYGVLKKDRLYVTAAKRKAAPMSNRTRKILTNLYRPFNEKLANMLKNQTFLWSNS